MRNILTTILLCILAGAVWSEPAIEVIELRHREASEVIPLLRPLLSESEAITGTGYQLFIKANPSTLSQLQKILTRLDQAPRSLLISVSNERDQSQEGYQIEGGAVIRSGDSRVVIGRPTTADGSGASVTADQYSTRDKGERHSQLRVTEGKPAFILREDLRVLPVRTYAYGAYGYSAIDQSTSIYSNQNGFYVTARMVDENMVNVDITPVFGDDRGDQTYNRLQTATTTVRASLGEWIYIGGTAEQRQSDHSGILARSKNSDQDNSEIYIKVDAVQ